MYVCTVHALHTSTRTHTHLFSSVSLSLPLFRALLSKHRPTFSPCWRIIQVGAAAGFTLEWKQQIILVLFFIDFLNTYGGGGGSLLLSPALPLLLLLPQTNQVSGVPESKWAELPSFRVGVFWGYVSAKGFFVFVEFQNVLINYDWFGTYFYNYCWELSQFNH